MKNYQLLSLNYQSSNISEELVKKITNLCNWMINENVTEASLATIKKQFPKWKTLPIDIDILVSQGILERYDRRYRFSVPLLNRTGWYELEKVVTSSCDKLIYQLSHNSVTSLACFIEFAKLPQQVYLAAEGVSEPYKDYHLLRTDNFIYLDSPSKLGYASYFKENQMKLPPVSHNLTKLLGDVNPDYFCEMVGKVIGTIKNQTDYDMVKRPNIFMESLELLGYISLSEERKISFDYQYIEVTKRELEKESSQFSNTFTEGLKECQSQLPHLDSEILELLMYRYLISSLQINKYLFAIKK